MPTIWGCPNQLLNRSAGPAGAHAGTVPRYAELAELAGQWEHAPGFAYIKETTETGPERIYILQLHYGNGVFGNFYLSVGQH